MCDPPGADLQAVLDTGEDLMLCASGVYDLNAPLEFRADGQSIFTGDATHPREYATLRIADPSMAAAVRSSLLDGISLERVIVDGNRTRLGAFTGPRDENLALVFLFAADDQTVRNVVIRNTRSWSSLQLHEGAGECRGGLVENNIVLWAGCDARGNGCAPGDAPGSWGDGISMPCRETVVRNNLVIDATDVGVVLFGAPGSTVEGNFVASVSRETLGGVALVDAMDLYAVSGTRADRNVVTDYRGDSVTNNDLAALGSRIHIGVAVGPAIWFGPDWLAARSLGPSITGNRLQGGAFGYGFVSNGSEQVRFEGNSSSATHAGMPDGVGGAAAAPGPFLYNASTTLAPAALQGEFVASDQLTSLLRLYSCPTNGAGFWTCDYTPEEAAAIVRLAYIEILGREPDAAGADGYVGRLLSDRLSADDLRRELMESDEFRGRYPGVPSTTMQQHRQAVWETALFDVVEDATAGGGAWPSASHLFQTALTALASGVVAPVPGASGAASCTAGPGAADELVRGAELHAGESRVSQDGRFRVVYQDDGNLVLYEAATGAPLWSSGTGGTAPGVTVMQCDGNLVVYDASGAARWSSGTAGSTGERLVVQNDGNLVVYDAAGRPLWASGTGGYAPAPPSDPGAAGSGGADAGVADPGGSGSGGGSSAGAGDTLSRGQELHAGESRVSQDGRFMVLYQDDGNLVLYVVASMAPLWSSETWGTAPGVAVMQYDGNLVVYDAAGDARWSSETGGSAGERMVVQNDGNLVVYTAADAAVWDSGTGGR